MFSKGELARQRRLERMPVKDLGDGVFMCGNKRVTTTISMYGKILARVGGGFVPLEQYVGINEETKAQSDKLKQK